MPTFNEVDNYQYIIQFTIIILNNLNFNIYKKRYFYTLAH